MVSSFYFTRRTSIPICGSLVLFTLVAAWVPTFAAEERDYLLATAGTDGTYYPVGVAIATLVKVKLRPRHGIVMTAISTAGSGENIQLLHDDNAQFAIVQGLYGYYAWNGIGPIEPQGPQTSLRSISMLWRDVEQFTVRSEWAETGTIADLEGLKGQRMAFGEEGSGAIESSRFLLGNLGIDIDRDYELSFGDYGSSARALEDGRIEGMSTPAGIPTAAVAGALEAVGDQIALLKFTQEQQQEAGAGLVLWTPYVIPAGTYAGLAKDINTLAQPNFLAVRAEVDEEVVYQITKTLYENLPFLQAIHAATGEMKIDHAVVGLPVPLHTGAARYYEEVGVQVPERLVAAP
jgi:hypothetical protein